jgi:hypothetical protein
VLDELDAIINGGKSVIMFTVFSDPGFVLRISGGLFPGIKGLISLSVLDGLSEVGFGRCQCGDSVVPQLGVSALLGDVVVDVGVQIKKNLPIE